MLCGRDPVLDSPGAIDYHRDCMAGSFGNGGSMRVKFDHIVLILLLSLCAVLSGCDRREDEGIVLTPRSAEEDAPWDTEPRINAEDETLTQAETLPAVYEAAGREAPLAAETAQEVSLPGQDASVYVHVCGAVEEAGVYELPQGSRIVDAVAAAGGFSEEADRSFVNLAGLVGDGMKIRIPTVEETEAADAAEEAFMPAAVESEAVPAGTQAIAGAGASGSGDGLVNINTAGIAELTTLPGIGEARAAVIIEYRETHGGFARIEDIMKVSGIKDKSFARLKDRIKV